MIGGLLTAILKISKGCIGKSQRFSMATNFMRKIYSVESQENALREESDSFNDGQAGRLGKLN